MRLCAHAPLTGRPARIAQPRTVTLPGVAEYTRLPMSPAEVVDTIVATFASRVRATLASGRRFAFAVPGGSFATRVFPALATLDLDWTRVDLTWVDERVVPLSDPDSNQKAAHDLWLSRLAGPGPRLIAPPVSIGGVAQVAAAWQAALVTTLGSPPRLDLAVLGVGPDGHVASLFPSHPALECLDVWVAGVPDSPKPPPSRVTLTLATLAHAREIWVVAFGSSKAAVVADARENPDSTLPVALVARSGPSVKWFLDADAGG
jgi:6-phosphogluconolactonase